MAFFEAIPTLTGVKYGYEILRLYAGAFGKNFISIDDNARSQRCEVIEDYLEDYGFEWIE